MDIRIIISDGTGTRISLDFNEENIKMKVSSSLEKKLYIGKFVFPMEDVIYLSVEEKEQ